MIKASDGHIRSSFFLTLLPALTILLEAVKVLPEGRFKTLIIAGINFLIALILFIHNKPAEKPNVK